VIAGRKGHDVLQAARDAEGRFGNGCGRTRPDGQRWSTIAYFGGGRGDFLREIFSRKGRRHTDGADTGDAGTGLGERLTHRPAQSIRDLMLGPRQDRPGVVDHDGTDAGAGEIKTQRHQRTDDC
jgi:hypothetical protein